MKGEVEDAAHTRSMISVALIYDAADHGSTGNRWYFAAWADACNVGQFIVV